MTYRKGEEILLGDIKKYILILTLACLTVIMFSTEVSAADPPVANFTANTTSTGAQSNIQFNDTSTGNPTSWKWDFGDGKTSTLKNPVHNYTKTGNFSVTLNVTNIAGTSNLTYFNYIKIFSSPISSYNNVNITTANNGTVYMQDLGSGGGLNAIHISSSTVSGPNYGQYTVTSNQSGVLYVTDTGGRGYQDDIILMIAVNGTIPDNFALKIKASGYTWTPAGFNTAPSPANITYQATSINQIYYKNDFIYGPQSWKMAGGNTAYPIYLNEDMTDTSNSFSLLFVDLHAGPLGSNYPSGNGALTDYGAVKINYIFQNLESIAAFNVYAWNANTTHGAGMGWTNSILPGQTGGPSGYEVIGSKKPTAMFSTDVNNGVVPLTVHFTDESTQTPTSWFWDFGDGTSSTEQNPTHVYNHSGNYDVTLTIHNAYDTNTTKGTITVRNIDVSASLPNGYYNTTQYVNLTAEDNLFPNPTIYYTLNGTDPTTNSQIYTGPIMLSDEGNVLLKFFAVDAGGNVSNIITMNYTIDETAPTAYTKPSGSTYTTKQNVSITASDNLDPNPVIYYTLDGTDPTNSATRVKYSEPITITSSTRLRYVAVDYANNWSQVYDEIYVMKYTNAPVPTANIASGLYSSDQVVTLTATDQIDPKPKIYYTLDGSNPTTKSTLYTWPISINTIGTTILKFIAVNNAGLVSNVITCTYTLNKQGAGGTWNSTAIAADGMYNSIAIDKSGNPHVVYYQVSSSTDDYPELIYAYKDSKGWHRELVDSSKAGSGFYVSMVLDSSNNPSMVYGEVFGVNSTDKLKYAYRDTTGWHITVLTQNSYISFINLALYNNQPRISFYNDSANNGLGELQYMYKNGTQWYIENVTTKSSGGRWNSLALDSKGNPRISYYDIYSGPVQGSLRYAERTDDGKWLITTVDGNMADPVNVGIWNSIAIDSDGNPHISYNSNLGGGGGSLKYTYYDGTNWITSIISTLKSSCSKLILTKSNSPLIVYEDVTTGNFKYAYLDGTKWIINNIDTVDGVGQWISLTLNGTGIPYVCYSTANSNIKYAYLIPFTVNATPGGTFNTTKLVVIKTIPGTTVYYTKDGSDPRTSSTKIKYTGAISINSTTTLKFAAVDTALNWSSITTSTYVINLPPTAAAGIKGGYYNTTKLIKLSMNQVGNIYYTTNGTTPTASSKKYTGSITITSTTMLKFIAINQKGQKSTIYSETYKIDKVAPVIRSTSPKNRSTGISRKGTVSIKFSENIATSVNWSKIYVKNLKTGKIDKITRTITKNTLNLKISKSRTSNTWYAVYIPSSSVKDAAGNKLTKAYTFKFKTGSK